MARLAAEIHLRSQEYAKRPKRKFVSASTKEYAWAEYLRGWVDRVERVGNLNYPDEARRRRIGGLVVISVAVRRDGSVESIRIVQSSDIPMLDDAALRIVKLSEPFAPLPKTARRPGRPARHPHLAVPARRRTGRSLGTRRERRSAEHAVEQALLHADHRLQRTFPACGVLLDQRRVVDGIGRRRGQVGEHHAEIAVARPRPPSVP